MKNIFSDTPYGDLRHILYSLLSKTTTPVIFVENMKAVIDIASFLGMPYDVYYTLVDYFTNNDDFSIFDKPLGICLHNAVVARAMFAKLLHGGIFVISGDNIIITLFFVKYCFLSGQKVRIQKKIPNFFTPLGYVIKERSCSTNLLIEY